MSSGAIGPLSHEYYGNLPPAKREAYDPYPFIFTNGAKLIDNAVAMIKNAQSWRKVFVGGTAVVNNPDTHDLIMTAGFNFSPRKGVKKYCAEMRSMGPPKHRGYTIREASINAFLYEDAEVEEVNESIIGVPSRILPPCDLCTDELEDHTLALSYSVRDNIFGIQTGHSLRQIHPQLHPLKKRENPTDHPYMKEPVFDYATLDWGVAFDVYKEYTRGLRLQDYDSQQEFRLARSSAAMLALITDVAQA